MVTFTCAGEKLGSTPSMKNPFCVNVQPAPGGNEAGRVQVRKIKRSNPPRELTWKSIVGVGAPRSALTVAGVGWVISKSITCSSTC